MAENISPRFFLGYFFQNNAISGTGVGCTLRIAMFKTRGHLIFFSTPVGIKNKFISSVLYPSSKPYAVACLLRTVVSGISGIISQSITGKKMATPPIGSA